MADSSKAVFLSYASQDAAAVERIAEALRATGVEVWFDKNELVGGDAWDQKIRRQIKECALFVPVISANTNARAEGYFRLEWKLAVDRSHLMADDAPFLFPVVIDDTTDAAARVPDKFREVQWTRLNVKDTPESLAARVAKILVGTGGTTDIARAAGRGDDSAAKKSSPAWLRHAWAIFGLVIGLIYAIWPLWHSGGARGKAPAPTPSPAASTVASTPPSPPSPARQLVAKARGMSLDKYDSSADDFATAEGLLKQALALDQNDAELWTFSSLFNTSMRTRGFDHAPVRREMARRDAERAVKLAPDSLDALFALGRAQRDFEPDAAEATFKKILARDPNHTGALGNLATIYDYAGRADEAVSLYERVATADPAHEALTRYTEFLLFFHYGRFAEAERCIRRSVTIQASANSQAGLAMLLLTWKGDADEAARVLASGPTVSRNEPRTIWNTVLVQLCRRAPDDALRTLNRFAGDYIQDNWFAGPKAYLAGRAHALAGRAEAARLAFETALTITDARLKQEPSNLFDHLMRGQLFAFLGRPDEALREARAVAELAGTRESYWFGSPALIYAVLGRADDAMPLLEKLCHPPPGQIVGWPLTPALLRLDPLWDKVRDDPRFQALCAEPKAETVAAPVAPDGKSVAVLAFANLSDDKANEYFSDGISEELLNVLAKIPGLKVSARTSAFHFKGKDTPIPEIARQLGVAYVVEGSVRKAGNQVRITAQLIKAGDGFHVWSETFTRELKDIFAVQDEIAGLIAKNLELKMGMTAARPTIDLEAYQEYLAGRAAAAKARMADLREAVTHFERAVALDSKFTAAWVQLASAHTRLGRWGGTPTQQAWPAARAAIAKAQALEPDSPDVLLALGWIRRTADWNWRGAEQAFRRALQLQPNQLDALAGAAVLLFNIGQTEEAFRLGRQAAQLDPLNPVTQYDLSLMFFFNQNWAESERAARRALQLAPGGNYHGVLSWSLSRQKRYAEAEAEAQRESDDVEQANALVRLAVAQGQEVAIRESRTRLEAIARKRGDDIADLQIALAYVATALGDRDRAFAALERARASRDPSMAWLRNDDSLAPLYSDPRWNTLLHRMGLADDQLK